MLKLTACLLALTLCLGGCSAQPAENAAPLPNSTPSSSATEVPAPPASSVPPPSSAAVDNSPLTAEQAEAMRQQLMKDNSDLFGGLTAAQMEEDFDYLWETIQTSYPFLGVAKRQGIDPEGLYKKYREALSKVTGDIMFANFVRDFVNEFQGLGHFSFFMDSGQYLSYRDLYGTLTDSPHCKIIYEQMTNPVTARSYAKLDELTQQILAIQARVEPKQAQPQSPAAMPGTMPDNLTTKILTPGKTAYLKISSFGSEYIEADRNRLLAFYKEAAGCENLIIDITGNGGGSDGYWHENIVKPNLSKPLTGHSYILFHGTPEIMTYYKSDRLIDDSLPIAKLPPLPKLVPEDTEALTRFYTAETKLSPSGSQPFAGKIWLLVDQQVYSSSESFAMFCKETGFATLVGTPTGGDGGGMDPYFFSMPNSGLGWRNSVFYTVNPDGSNSEEFGTTPDILSPAGETPLDTSLKAIGS